MISEHGRHCFGCRDLDLADELERLQAAVTAARGICLRAGDPFDVDADTTDRNVGRRAIRQDILRALDGGS